MAKEGLTLGKYIDDLFNGKYIEAGKELMRISEEIPKRGLKHIQRYTLARIASQCYIDYINAIDNGDMMEAIEIKTTTLEHLEKHLEDLEEQTN